MFIRDRHFHNLSGLIFVFALFFPHLAHSADYQQCTISSTCTIGEYLYADDYSPLVGASCTLTAKYPDGTTYLNDVPMSSSADGWYQHAFTTDNTVGLYHSTICCTPASGKLCLDKTFEVKSPVSTGASAADIWNYSSRTLTSYGTLVSDIWNYSSRSLTNFGNLVENIWQYSSRTMTSFGSLVANIWDADNRSLSANSSDSSQTISAISQEQQAQRLLLEKLVNTPIITLSLEDSKPLPNLDTKIEESKKQANLLFDSISSAKARLQTLDSKWNRIDKDSTVKEILAIAESVQTPEPLQIIQQKWDTTSVDQLTQAHNKLKNSLSSLLASTTLTKNPLPPSSLTDSLIALDNIEIALGDATSSSTDSNFVGFLASVEERQVLLEGEKQKVATILEKLPGQGEKTASSAVNAIQKRLTVLNQYPGGESLIQPAKNSQDGKINLKNILYSLQALIGLNQQLLAMDAGDPIRSLWLEEGSIIFRAVITNPSSLVAQTVPLKFYLPKEVKESDILELDSSLASSYDPTEEAILVKGTYELPPKATKVVFVELQDIWVLSDDELLSLRKQAESLLKPLDKTAYYSQGITLKSTIDATLDKLMLSRNNAISPENRIRAYREGKLELIKISTDMNRLQDLVAQASGNSALFGYVGSVQTIGVWGIILVVIAGFVFLSTYFKKIGSSSQSPTLLPNSNPTPHLSPLTISPTRSFGWHTPIMVSSIVIITIVATLAAAKLFSPNPTQVSEVSTNIVSSPSPTDTPQPSPSPLDRNQQVQDSDSSADHLIHVESGTSVNIRNQPSIDGQIIRTIKKNTNVIIFRELGEWRQIGFTPDDFSHDYWVHSQFIETIH